MTRPVLPVLAAVFAALALVACQTERPSPPSRLPSLYAPLANSGAAVDAATARDMINAYRRNNGVGSLDLDPDLQAAAQAEAAAMAASGKPGSAEAFKARLMAAGFPAPAVNLSAGYHTLAEAFSGWRESAPHNRVLLDPRAGRIGIATAYAPNSKYKVYWVYIAVESR